MSTTANQARVLAYLAEQPTSVNRATIQRTLSLGVTTCDDLLESLLYRSLINKVQKSAKHPIAICITADGRLALANHGKPERDTQHRVPPSRNNLFTLPVYAAPVGGYCRNNGHTHIQSRGVSC